MHKNIPRRARIPGCRRQRRRIPCRSCQRPHTHTHTHTQHTHTQHAHTHTLTHTHGTYRSKATHVIALVLELEVGLHAAVHVGRADRRKLPFPHLSPAPATHRPWPTPIIHSAAEISQRSHYGRRSSGATATRGAGDCGQERQAPRLRSYRQGHWPQGRPPAQRWVTLLPVRIDRMFFCASSPQ